MIKLWSKGKAFLVFIAVILLTACMQSAEELPPEASPSVVESSSSQSVVESSSSQSDAAAEQPPYGNTEDFNFYLPIEIWLCDIGDTYQIQKSKNSLVEWYTSDAEDVVSVDEFGKLEVTGKGVCHIYVTAETKPEQYHTQVITVVTEATNIELFYFDAQITQVALDKQKPRLLVPTEIRLSEVGETYQIKPFLVGGAKASSYQYLSEAKDIVTVDEFGNIKAIGGGLCTIYVDAKLESGGFLHEEIFVAVFMTESTQVCYAI